MNKMHITHINNYMGILEYFRWREVLTKKQVRWSTGDFHLTLSEHAVHVSRLDQLESALLHDGSMVWSEEELRTELQKLYKSPQEPRNNLVGVTSSSAPGNILNMGSPPPVTTVSMPSQNAAKTDQESGEVVVSPSQL